MNAWLLTWEGTEGPALSKEDKLVAILPGRMSQNSVEQIVGVLYTRCIGTASDLIYYANRRKEKEKRYMYVTGAYPRIFYGYSQCFIYARQVTKLVIEKCEEQQLEHVRWTEYPYLIQNSEYKLVEKEPETPRELTRTLIPVSAEIYPRRERVIE